MLCNMTTPDVVGPLGSVMNGTARLARHTRLCVSDAEEEKGQATEGLAKASLAGLAWRET